MPSPPPKLRSTRDGDVSSERRMRDSSHSLALRRVVIAAVLLLLPALALLAGTLDFSSSNQPGIIRGPSERDPQTLGSLPYQSPTATATLPPGVTPTATPT